MPAALPIRNSALLDTYGLGELALILEAGCAARVPYSRADFLFSLFPFRWRQGGHRREDRQNLNIVQAGNSDISIVHRYLPLCVYLYVDTI